MDKPSIFTRNRFSNLLLRWSGYDAELEDHQVSINLYRSTVLRAVERSEEWRRQASSLAGAVRALTKKRPGRHITRAEIDELNTRLDGFDATKRRVLTSYTETD